MNTTSPLLRKNISDKGLAPASSNMQKQALENQVSVKPKIFSPLIALSQQKLNVLEVIAPETIETDFDFIKINNIYFRTIFVSGYPRFVAPGWLEPVVNFDSSLDVSFYIYPSEGKTVLDSLRRKITEMEAEISSDIGRGKIVDPTTEAKLEDARVLQEQLVKGSERFFEFSFYITIPAETLGELNHLTKQVESTLGSLMIVAKHTTLDMENGFLSTIPFGVDKLMITRNMDTTSLATTFPFTSTELSSDKGILYGINAQNESFIIFDRFSMENANMSIFATSGAGKSTDYDEPVMYQDKNGITKLEKIGKIVEREFKRNKSINLEKEIEGIINPNLKVYAFDNNLKGLWSNVTIAARKISPKTLFKITTKSGRDIKITKDHCLLVLKDGKIITSKGNQIKPNDYIPLTRKLVVNKNPLKPIDVVGLLKNNKNIKFLKISHGRVGNRLFSLKTSIPIKLIPSSRFFEFLGFFVAEGMNNKKRILISNTTKEVLDSSINYFKSLGLAYSLARKDKKRVGVYVSAQVFVETFTALGALGKSMGKKVPAIVVSAPDNEVARFLRAYFEGDGTVGKSEISATTKSKSLVSDLSYLLLRFGIIIRISKTRKSATNTLNKVKRTYYKITISGQENIKRFSEDIGFISKYKNNKLRQLIRKANTNVDSIPELKNVFKEIYETLYSSSEIPAPKKFSEIKLGIFKPSRNNLLSIIKQMETRIEKIENLEKDGLSTLRKLPEIKEIVDAGKQKDLNRKLWLSLGQSWRTIKQGVQPYLQNALIASNITHNYHLSQNDVGSALYRIYKVTGESLREFDKSLWGSVVMGNCNPQYKRLIKGRDYISKKYQEKKTALEKTKKQISWLKTLATSDLFWDPITKIEKIKSKHKYVYDLQVDNGVFLAGFGGMFIHNSYFVKLEALRSLMLGTEVIVIDPESEYKPLAEAVGGEFISFSFNSPSKINPFDLSQVYEEGENQLGLKILSLHSLFKVIMGKITPTQEALLDRALVATYRGKGITQDPSTQKSEPPLMEDLYKTLIGMEIPDALDLAARIEKFVRGSFVGIFDKQTNINLNNPFTVFSVKDLQDVLRPIAMFTILDYIWTRIKKDLKRRLLIVDEAWHMMRYPDSAQFLWSVVKRARKYFLGLTTITQDVEDFLAQDIGKAIVTNSSMQLLLKQSPAAIDKIADVFYLSQGEKQLLLSANIGEGIFFAGQHHAPVRIVASKEEHEIITAKPQELKDQGLFWAKG